MPAPALATPVPRGRWSPRALAGAAIAIAGGAYFVAVRPAADPAPLRGGDPPPAMPSPPPSPAIAPPQRATPVLAVPDVEITDAAPAAKKKIGAPRFRRASAVVPGPDHGPASTPASTDTAAAPTASSGADTGSPLAIQEPREHTEADLQRAEDLLADGQLRAACSLGESIVERDGTVAAVHGFLGRCHTRAGDVDRAKANYRRYLQLAPDAPDAPFVRAIVDRKR